MKKSTTRCLAALLPTPLPVCLLAPIVVGLNCGLAAPAPAQPATTQIKPTPQTSGGIVVKVGATPKPKFRPRPTPRVIILKPKVAVGRRVRVVARLVITNSDDGVGGIFGNSDKKCELDGVIRLGEQTAIYLNNRSAEAGDEIRGNAMKSVTLRYSDPNHQFFPVNGHIRDYDTASAADTLWFANRNIDLLRILQSNSEFLIKGDHNSENADLYIRVYDEGEVFK